MNKENISAICNWITIARRNLANVKYMAEEEEKKEKLNIAVYYIDLALDFLNRLKGNNNG